MAGRWSAAVGAPGIAAYIALDSAFGVIPGAILAYGAAAAPYDDIQ